MARLEGLTAQALVSSIKPGQLDDRHRLTWLESDAFDITFRDLQRQADTILLLCYVEPTLEIQHVGQIWSFDATDQMFQPVSEARRTRLVSLFGPPLAIHSSYVDPRPSQITAEYEKMLLRQPLRFLIARVSGPSVTFGSQKLRSTWLVIA